MDVVGVREQLIAAGVDAGRADAAVAELVGQEEKRKEAERAAGRRFRRAEARGMWPNGYDF
jgi:hypothetical protein